MGKVIDVFRGDFAYLSNFSPHEFIDEHDVDWRTNEHYFQAAKTFHPLWKMLIWDAPKPGIAKKLGADKDLLLRDDWDSVRIPVMERGIFYKFEQNPDIKKKLLSTKGFELVEGNKWHDNFWGDCTCKKCLNIKGLNWLGQLLMMYRDGLIYRRK